MKRLGYLGKLSLAARWFLPQEEAESVIEDYRDILSEVGGQKEAVERFGKPWRPVMELADNKKVRRWHMFFILMVFCAIMPVLFLFFQYVKENYFFTMERISGTFIWLALYMFGLDIILGGSNSRVMTWISIAVLTAVVIFVFFLGPMEVLEAVFLSWVKEFFFGKWFPTRTYAEGYAIIGSVISLLYFRFGRNRGKPIPRLLIACLLTAALVVVGIYGFVMYCFHIDFGPMLHILRVQIICVAAAVLFLIGAIVGIVLARMYDARWRALYIVCIIGMVLCFKTLSDTCWNMSPSLWVFVDNYNAGIGPNVEWVHDITVKYAWYLGTGTVLTALGLL